MRWMLLCLALVGGGVHASDDAQALASLLEKFLAGVSAGDASVHEWFWDDDLVYTSSSGERRGKADILASDDEDEAADVAPVTSPVYHAEAVDIRVYGDAAVVAFELVAEMPAQAGEPAVTMRYYNTGTFIRRASGWAAVAWQATRIP